MFSILLHWTQKRRPGFHIVNRTSGGEPRPQLLWLLTKFSLSAIRTKRLTKWIIVEKAMVTDLLIVARISQRLADRSTLKIED
jgi:hypothetical protein